jgi:hypothetical protein
MSNIVTVNSGSAINGSLKAGRVSISTDSSITPSSGGKTWYNMINPAEGYVFISDPKVQGYNDGPPIIYPTQTSLPADILATVNGLPDRRGSVPFDNVWDALVWVQSTGKYFILDKTLNGPSSDEIVFVLDGSNYSSYPQSGSNAFDISNTSTSGILENGVEFDEVTNSFVFDGTDDRIRMTNKSPLGQAQEWSLSALVKFTQNSNWNVIVDPSSYGTACNYMLWLHSGSPTKLMATYDGSWSYGTIALSPDRWYHLSLTKASSGGKVRFFVNGEFDVERTLSFNTNTNVNDLYLGRRDNGDYQLPGNIANLRLYNKKLSDPQIKQNHFGAPIVTDNLAYKWDAGNLVSYDKSGTTTYNLAGSISGSLENGVAFNNPNGGTWEFDGSNDRIVLESSITPGNGNWTVTAWVKGKGAIVGNTSGGPIANSFGISNAGNITYYNYDGAWQSHVGNTTLSRSEWYMLTWVNYAGATAQDGTMKMYVNGVADSSIFNSYTTNGGPFNDIGHSVYLPNGSTYFDGEIANVQVNTGTAFTDAQVVDQYNAEYPRFKSSRDIPKEGLKIHYDLTDPNCYLSGTTVYDLSGNGNNGAVSNGAYFNPLRNGSIDMDGTDDYIITNFSGNTSTTSYTVINVMKSDNNSSDINNRQSIFGFDDGDGIGYNVLCQEIWGQGGYGFVGDGSNYTIWSWTASGAKENIQVYGCVRTPTQVKTYVNGALTTTYNNSNRVSAFTRYTIGERGPSGGNNWDGQVFYSLVYDRELSADEINRIYNTINTRFAVALPRTVTDSLALTLDAGDITSYPREGTTWYDRSGNGNNGTLTNGPIYEFVNGGVIGFDGVDDYVTFGNPSSMSNAQVTVTFWYNPTTLMNSTHNGIMNGRTPGGRFCLFWLNGTTLSTQYRDDSGLSAAQGGVWTRSNAPVAVSANKWYFIQITGNESTNEWRVGVDLNVSTSSFSSQYVEPDATNWLLGRRTGTAYDHSKIANVQVYDRILTPSEVLENYKSTRSRFGNDGIVTSGLVFSVDAGNVDSYQNSSTTTTSLAGSVTGTLVNGVGFSSECGGTWEFDGVDDIITTDFPVSTISNVTIEAVVYRNQATNRYEAIIQNNLASDDALYVNPSGYLMFWPCASSTLTVPIGQWSHVAVSFNGSTLTYIVNGTVQALAASCSHITDWDFLRIGGHSTTDSERWIGKIAVAKVYNQSLSSSQLIQNYNAYRNRFGLD